MANAARREGSSRSIMSSPLDVEECRVCRVLGCSVVPTTNSKRSASLVKSSWLVGASVRARQLETDRSWRPRTGESSVEHPSLPAYLAVIMPFARGRKVVKRCPQGHEMEMAWRDCPRCTGRRARDEVVG